MSASKTASIIKNIPALPPKSPARAVRRDYVLRTAARLFLQHGIEPVKMTDIADAAGVGVASVYRYFETKNNLAIEVGTALWQAFGVSFARVVKKATTEQTGLARMRMLFEQFATTFRRSPEAIAFLDEIDRIILSGDVESSLVDSYDSEIASYFTPFYAAFEQGVADGSIRSEIDFPLYYRTVSHSLISEAQRLVRGEVLKSDDYSHGEQELQFLIDMAMYFLGKGE